MLARTLSNSTRYAQSRSIRVNSFCKLVQDQVRTAHGRLAQDSRYLGEKQCCVCGVYGDRNGRRDTHCPVLHVAFSGGDAPRHCWKNRLNLWEFTAVSARWVERHASQGAVWSDSGNLSLVCQSPNLEIHPINQTRNAPYVFAIRSAATAIATGNTVILKGSELNASLLLGRRKGVPRSWLARWSPEHLVVFA